MPKVLGSRVTRKTAMRAGVLNYIDDVCLSAKRTKMDDDALEPLKQILLDIHKTILSRLDSMEEKILKVTHRCQCLEEKIEALTLQCVGKFSKNLSSSEIESNIERSQDEITVEVVSKPNVSVVTLNSEEDYPDGSWLGDESEPELRVRCRIIPRDLHLINASCQTPEKLALRLLDFLFDREIQACSNISGQGKHGKDQLDPLMIYGIHCHLKYKFDLTEKHWGQIKKNLDSKCRFAYQRKQRGTLIKVKTFKMPPLTSNSALASSVTDQQSDSSCNSNMTDLASRKSPNEALSYGLLITEIQGSDSEMSPQVKDQRQYSTVNVQSVCTNQIVTTVETWDHKDATIIGLAHGTFGILTDSTNIDLEHQEPQIIHTALGDVQLVHTMQHQLTEDMEADGKRAHSFLNTEDLSIQPSPGQTDISIHASNIANHASLIINDG